MLCSGCLSGRARNWITRWLRTICPTSSTASRVSNRALSFGRHTVVKGNQKAYNRQWYLKNKHQQHVLKQRNHQTNKRRALTHYGPNGVLQCSWIGCSVVDIDMLSLDHINHDGATERKNVGMGYNTYLRVIKQGFPAGFQTLCMNHQFKKEALHRKFLESNRSGKEEVVHGNQNT